MNISYKNFKIEMFAKRHPVVMSMFGIIAMTLDIATFALPCYMVASHCLGFGFAAEIGTTKVILLATISAFGIRGVAKILAYLMGAIIQG